jgi:hypothetical protein
MESVKAEKSIKQKEQIKKYAESLIKSTTKVVSLSKTDS